MKRSRLVALCSLCAFALLALSALHAKSAKKPAPAKKFSPHQLFAFFGITPPPPVKPPPAPLALPPWFPPPVQRGWQPLSGNIWIGTKVFAGIGPQKTLVFEVTAIDDRYIDPADGKRFRAIQVRYPTGTLEWKDREALIAKGYFFVWVP